VHALRGVDLDIERNSFTLIMGPSGSGKSTLLYLLGGLDRPTSGQVFVDGQEINTLDENAMAHFRRHTVGFIFQSYNLIPTMTALENVIFPMRFSRNLNGNRKMHALELLKSVGLGDHYFHKPTELSGGQQQRVAIARALVNQPALILADEPTGNLDTASGESIMNLLVRLHQVGTTIVMVTHDARLTGYATHVVEIIDGHIVAQPN
jgi:putative ABC transport system ATP-binding protein